MRLLPILALSLLLAACAAPTTPGDTFDAPPELPPPPPAPPSEPLPEEAADEQPSPPAGSAGDDRAVFTGIACDLEEERLSFTLANRGEQRWQLDQDVTFPPPQGLAPATLFINNYEANRGTSQYRDGERLFGPHERLSENCGGVAELAPGDEARCTLQPVPLQAERNRLWLDVPLDVEHVTFDCG